MGPVFPPEALYSPSTVFLSSLTAMDATHFYQPDRLEEWTELGEVLGVDAEGKNNGMRHLAGVSPASRLDLDIIPDAAHRVVSLILLAFKRVHLSLNPHEVDLARAGPGLYLQPAGGVWMSWKRDVRSAETDISPRQLL
jgi:hypothetical protein